MASKEHNQCSKRFNCRRQITWTFRNRFLKINNLFTKWKYFNSNHTKLLIYFKELKWSVLEENKCTNDWSAYNLFFMRNLFSCMWHRRLSRCQAFTMFSAIVFPWFILEGLREIIYVINTIKITVCSFSFYFNILVWLAEKCYEYELFENHTGTNILI